MSPLLSIVQRGARVAAPLDAAAPAETHLLGTGSPVVRRTGDPTSSRCAVNADSRAANGVSSRDAKGWLAHAGLSRAAAPCGTGLCPRPEHATSVAAGSSGGILHHTAGYLPAPVVPVKRRALLPGLGIVAGPARRSPVGARDNHAATRDELRARTRLYGLSSGAVLAPPARGVS